MTRERHIDLIVSKCSVILNYSIKYILDSFTCGFAYLVNFRKAMFPKNVQV